jgi:ribosomal protein L7/L12
MAKTKMTADDLLDQFKDMTLLELSDFVKKFEETFDVQAAAAPDDDGRVREPPVAPPKRSRSRPSSTSS